MFRTICVLGLLLELADARPSLIISSTRNVITPLDQLDPCNFAERTIELGQLMRKFIIFGVPPCTMPWKHCHPLTRCRCAVYLHWRLAALDSRNDHYSEAQSMVAGLEVVIDYLNTGECPFAVETSVPHTPLCAAPNRGSSAHCTSRLSAVRWPRTSPKAHRSGSLRVTPHSQAPVRGGEGR